MATITKRGDNYRIRVSDGYDVHGKQKMRTMTWKPEPGMTRRQIDKELTRQAVLFEDGEETATSEKFEDFAKKWFKEYGEKRLREKTLERYHQLEERTYAAIGHKRLDKITRRTIQSFIEQLEEPGINQVTGGTLAPKTIKHYVSFVSDVMAYAVRMELIQHNPCSGAILPTAKSKEKDIYTLEETQHVLDLLQNEPIIYQVFFTLAIYGGFRRGELLGLEWKDIDFKNCIISIRRSSLYSHDKGIFTDTTKTQGSARSLKLPSGIFDLLRKYKVQQSEQRLKVGDQWEDHDRLFVAWNGKPMNPNTPYSWYDRFCKRVGIRRIGIHAFRHLNATLLIDSGASVKTVSAALGHAQVSTTLNIYAHSIAESQARASEAVAAMLPLHQKKA